MGKNKAMGVTIVPYKGQNIEIATYRKDVYDILGNAKGADKVEITTSFKDDTSRRDFTINSLGIDKNGNIIDHHNGIKDIKNKIIAAVGDPNIRFKEDAARLLRAIRFASRLGFQIDQKTIEAIKSNAPEIQKVASERILKELNKMAEQTGVRFAQAIVMLQDLGLLEYILPEVLQLKDFQHSPEHHPEGGPLIHTIEALKTYKGNDSITNFAILLHDIGKGRTYKLSDKGTHSYHGHAEESGKMVEEIGKRLKMDNKTIEAIKFAVENHMKVSEIPKMNNSTIAQLIKSPYFNILMDTAKADWMARGSLYNDNDWQEVLNKINKVRELTKGKDIIDTVKKVVNGALIMRLRPDVKPGPLMGKIIKDTIDYVINNEVDLTDMETIEKFIKEWK
jgi:tRNA nucleotidyltransferase/poly(A) polymerase